MSSPDVQSCFHNSKKLNPKSLNMIWHCSWVQNVHEFEDHNIAQIRVVKDTRLQEAEPQLEFRAQSLTNQNYSSPHPHCNSSRRN